MLYTQDLCGPLLPSLAPCILRGLHDVDDDVRAVAAASLLPVADKLHLVLPDKVSQIMSLLIKVVGLSDFKTKVCIQYHLRRPFQWCV